MARNDGAGTRKERINKIATNIHAIFFKKKEDGEPQEIDLSKFIGFWMLNMGLTSEKIVDYLKIIEINEQCILDFENDQIKKPSL